MKKILIIVGTVAVLILLTWYADKATRLKGQPAANPASNPASSVAGKPEPDLKLKDLDGKDVSLADYKGKVVFLNFWATWCDPCLVKFPGSLICKPNTLRAVSPSSAWPWTRKAKASSLPSLPRSASTSTASNFLWLSHPAWHRRSGQVWRHPRLPHQLPDFPRRQGRHQIPGPQEQRRTAQSHRSAALTESTMLAEHDFQKKLTPSSRI